MINFRPFCSKKFRSKGIPDIFELFIRPLHLLAKHVRVRIKSEIRVAAQETPKTTAVIVMPMAQNHRVELTEIDSQDFRIMGERRILAGIEQNSPIARFYVK
jgi:hypothetical protein